MRRLLVVGLVVVLLVVGVALWLPYLGTSPNSSPLPARSADTPLLVLEPPAPDSDRTPLVALPDLSKVDRRVLEPAGLIKPRYCLLVFGPQAKTRVWIVQAGEVLYVDRNANGDLTEADEVFTPTDSQEFMTVGEDGKQVPYREWTYAAGDIVPSDGTGRHTQFRLVRHQTGDGQMEYVLSVRVGDVLLQYAGWGPLLADTRESAPVVHFGGPVVPKPLRGSSLRLAEDHPELHFCIGTPGSGSHSFAYVGYEAVPVSIRPVVEMVWPTQASVVTERFALARRC